MRTSQARAGLSAPVRVCSCLPDLVSMGSAADKQQSSQSRDHLSGTSLWHLPDRSTPAAQRRSMSFEQATVLPRGPLYPNTNPKAPFFSGAGARCATRWETAARLGPDDFEDPHLLMAPPASAAGVWSRF
jgi:hypothetical protein